MWELGIWMLKHHRIRTQMHAFQQSQQTLDVPISIEIQLISLKWVSSQTDRILSLCRAYQKPILRWVFTAAKLFPPSYSLHSSISYLRSLNTTNLKKKIRLFFIRINVRDFDANA